MGLDMYLSAKKYVSGYKHSVDTQDKYQMIKAAVGLEGIEYEKCPSLTVSVNVAYWRKANAIHAWFVKNVQKGVDDCGDYYVEDDQLKALVDVCEMLLLNLKTTAGKIHVGTQWKDGGKQEMYDDGTVISNPELAAEMLPSQGGFFFGGTDYDEGYLSDLKATVEQVKPLLTDERFKDFSFEYHASW